MTAYNRHRFRPSFQPLEDRVCPAGSVLGSEPPTAEADTHLYTTGGIYEIIVTVRDDVDGSTEDRDTFFRDAGQDDNGKNDHDSWIHLQAFRTG